jgi:hypothetical protein
MKSQFGKYENKWQEAQKKIVFGETVFSKNMFAYALSAGRCLIRKGVAP